MSVFEFKKPKEAMSLNVQKLFTQEEHWYLYQFLFWKFWFRNTGTSSTDRLRADKAGVIDTLTYPG